MYPGGTGQCQNTVENSSADQQGQVAVDHLGGRTDSAGLHWERNVLGSQFVETFDSAG